MRSICSKCLYLLICDALHKDSTVKCEDFKSNIITNADRIRSMTDEELAEYLYIKTCEDGFPQFTTENDWLDWLKQEAE